MKKMLKLLVVTFLFALCFSAVTFAESIESFSDLPEDHWAYSTVMPMVEKGIFNGTSTPVDGVGTFSPNKPMTRAEFLAVLCRTYFADEIYTPASDLPWWDPYFTIGTKNGLFSYRSNFIQLDVEMNRAEAAVMITKTFEALGTPLTEKTSYILPDSNAIYSYGKMLYGSVTGYPSPISALQDSISLCVGGGIIGGVDDKGTFDPQGKLTRAAAATILCRMLDEEKRLSEDRYKGILEERVPYIIPNCENGEHYLEDSTSVDDEFIEVVKYATETESGIARIHCHFCDYYVEVVTRPHVCQGDLGDYLRCGDKIWDGHICLVSTITDIPDSKAILSGYKGQIRVHCGKRWAYFYDKKNITTREDALHQFSDWEIVSYPGKGVEGRLEKKCKNCDRYEFLMLPMYSTDDAVLDVRESYFGKNHSCSNFFADNGDNEHNRLKVDYSKDAKYNRSVFADLVGNLVSLALTDEGLYYSHYNYGQGHTLRFHNDYENDRFGINVLSFSGPDKEMVFEGIYFFSGDREVTYALCEVLNFLYTNGSEATTREKIAEYGFEVWDETENSIKLSMKNINIFWEWNNSWPGNTFYFSK